MWRSRIEEGGEEEAGGEDGDVVEEDCDGEDFEAGILKGLLGNQLHLPSSQKYVKGYIRGLRRGR